MRCCDVCETIFDEGYYDERDSSHYCSIECAVDDMTSQEMKEGLNSGQLYWSTFYEEDEEDEE